MSGTSYPGVEQILVSSLRLDRRPVAVAFPDAAPRGVEEFTGTEPSGCSFWRLAAQGKRFFTRPAQHANCAIGSYTHNIPLPAERASELEQTLGFMTSAGYIEMEEVPGIPRLPKSPTVVVYAPLGDTPVDPDVVLVAGKPGRLMLLQEAALRAGVAAQMPLAARPTCMALPAALANGLVASSGCVGNRVYTGIGDDELYVVIPGRDLAAIVDALGTITSANRTLEEYHKQRRMTLATE